MERQLEQFNEESLEQLDEKTLAEVGRMKMLENVKRLSRSEANFPIIFEVLAVLNNTSAIDLLGTEIKEALEQMGIESTKPESETARNL